MTQRCVVHFSGRSGGVVDNVLNDAVMLEIEGVKKKKGFFSSALYSPNGSATETNQNVLIPRQAKIQKSASRHKRQKCDNKKNFHRKQTTFFFGGIFFFSRRFMAIYDSCRIFAFVVQTKKLNSRRLFIQQRSRDTREVIS